MARTRAVHLFNHDRGARYHLMIAQGLMGHPDVDVTFNTPVISFGEVTAEASNDIQARLLEADYIFRPDDMHFGIEELDRFLERNRLWRKVVYYDKQDSPRLNEHRLRQCCAYLKRSWPIDFERRSRPLPNHPVLPMDYGVLHEYILASEPPSRDIDVTCAFREDPDIGWRRYGLVHALSLARHRFGKTVIGSFTTQKRHGRRAIYQPSQNNPFLRYLHTLNRSRIVFTASPDNHGGDSRTWEALASGALVFKDDSGIPSAYPLEHGKHCILYDSASEASIQEAIETADHFLRHESERAEIAKRGFEYARRHHAPAARIDAILAWIRSPDKNLWEHVKGESSHKAFSSNTPS